MKKQLLILALALIASVGFYSCEKKYQVIPPPTPFSSLRDSFQFMYNDNRQNFSFNGTAGGQFVSEDGIQFTVPNHAFRDGNGDTIFGTVDVELIEIITPSDMILMNKTTTSDGDPLVTGGQFKATFTSNENPVFISEDTVLYVRVPTEISDPNMRVFNGTEDATGFLNWKPAPDSIGDPLKTTITSETLTNGIIQDYYTFVMNSSSANWINCDYFYDVPGTKTELMVALPDEHKNSNTLFFIHFNSIQSVMGGFFDGNNFVSNGRIPIGTAVELVFVSEIDGDYKSKFIPITVSNGYSNTITLDPTTYDDIIEDIKEL